MEYLSLEHLTPRAFILGALVIVAGWLLYKATKHLIVAAFCTILALGGVAWALDIVTLDKAKAMVQDVDRKAGELGESASGRMKRIGGQAYGTSAGEGGVTNEAYKKHIENK